MTATRHTQDNAKAIILGRGGTIADAADCANFPVAMPFAGTLTAMKVTMKTAPSGAMAVQLRTATAPITTAPTYADVPGFVATFVAGQVSAKIDPDDVDVLENDWLNFSLTTSSGSSILVEVIVAA